jgi:hypothetical protein
MDVFQYMLAGCLGGLLVANWNSFKDSPWEDFKYRKYVRSPLFGIAAGMLIYTLVRFYGMPPFLEFGTLVFSTMTIERIFGEAYKGLFRKGYHIEFKTGFKFYGVEGATRHYWIRALSGVVFVIGAIWLFLWLNSLLFESFVNMMGTIVYGMFVGFLGGTIIAFSGALKDVPWEGFKIRKFIRSPAFSLVGGGIVAFLSRDIFYMFLAIPGIERGFVETYKTFWKEGIRGIFEGKKPKYKKWFGKRWVFKLMFFAILGITVLSLIIQ